MTDGPTPSPASPTRPARKIFRRLAYAAAIIAVWYLLTSWRIQTAQRKPLVLPVVWTAGSADPPPKDFRFVLFPPAEGITLWDKPGGNAIGTVGRAVTGSIEERTLELVPVTDGAASGFVEQAKLRWYVPSSEVRPMIDAMIRDRRTRGPQFRDFNLAATLPEGGHGEAVVQMTVDGITSRSIYTLDGSSVLPIRFESATRPWIVMNSPVGDAVLLRFVLFFPVAALAYYILRRR